VGGASPVLATPLLPAGAAITKTSQILNMKQWEILDWSVAKGSSTVPFGRRRRRRKGRGPGYNTHLLMLLRILDYHYNGFITGNNKNILSFPTLCRIIATNKKNELI